jgi:hypothetical protein
MNTQGQSEQPGSFAAKILHVPKQPDENLAILSQMEFQVLIDGEVNNARAGRDLCLGLLGSAVIGLIGLVATVDWDTAFHKTLKAPFFFTLVLCVIAAASCCGAIIQHQSYRHKRNGSAYSSLMKKLTDQFGPRD